jgi:hypothetical protein
VYARGARPDRWPWSSHAATAAGAPPDWMDDGALMAYFSAHGGEPRQRHREFVALYRS